VYTGAGRERGAGAGEPTELGVPVREAARVAGAAAALPQRAQLRLVRRPAPRRAQHPWRRPIPTLAAGEFAIDRSIAHGAGRVSRGGGKALARRRGGNGKRVVGGPRSAAGKARRRHWPVDRGGRRGIEHGADVLVVHVVCPSKADAGNLLVERLEPLGCRTRALGF